MSQTIGEAYLQIRPSMDGIQNEITSAMGGIGESSGSTFGSRFASGLSSVGRIGAAAVATTAAATTALVGGMVSATSSVAEYGDNIDKMSQKMGISAEAYQEWEAVMQHSGTSMESLQASMRSMANAVENGNEAFQRLGISEEEVASLSQEDLFARVISGLQDMEAGTERTYLAGQLLGRGANELGALLNTSSEDTQAMIQAVHDLGGVMSDDAVKAAAGFQDSLQDMQTAMSGVTRSAMSQFLPSMTNVMDGIAQVFSGNTDLGLESIQEGIDQFIASLNETMPKLIEVGMGIIEALATAIIENIPQLAQAAIQIITEMVTYLIENLPMLIDVAFELILTLANGIIEALPDLIPALVDVILTIVDKLTDPDTLVQLVEAALQLMIALAEGLIAALPKLIEKAPTIIANLVEAIIRVAPELLKAALELVLTLAAGIVDSLDKLIEKGAEIVDSVKEGFFQKVEEAKSWGKDMIQNFIDGIKAKWENLKSTVTDLASTIKSLLGFSEPEDGPLSNFHTFAPDMMMLFSKGIRDNLGMIQDAMGAVTGTIAADFSTAQIGSNSYSGIANPYEEISGVLGTNMAADGGDIVIPVYIGQEKLDTIIITAQQRRALVSGGR